MQFTNAYSSPFGAITLASDGECLTGLWFNEQKYFAANLATNHKDNDLPIFEQTNQWLDLYFTGHNPDFTPPLSLSGSDFRLLVFDILMQIPYGHTLTYGDIGARVATIRGQKTFSSQAVGGAVGITRFP